MQIIYFIILLVSPKEEDKMNIVDKSEIKADIEKLRALLNNASGPISTGKVLENSKKLDELIVKYYRISGMTA